MVSPELWAVKRISKAVPNFSLKRCEEEIENLQKLSNVSIVQTCPVSQQALVSVDLWGVLSDVSIV